MIGKLNQEWHGVPAGTALEIIKTIISFGEPIHHCRRADGENLPGPWGKGPTGCIATKFVDLD